MTTEQTTDGPTVATNAYVSLKADQALTINDSNDMLEYCNTTLQ